MERYYLSVSKIALKDAVGKIGHCQAATIYIWRENSGYDSLLYFLFLLYWI